MANYVMPITHEESEDEDADDEDDQDPTEEWEYKAPVAGRDHGIQHVPRFDLEKIRPFEIMFVDNKDYDGPVRGNVKTAFVFIDLKTRAKFKIDLATKKSNGTALSRIIAMNGIHKLPYKCTVYSDGCGSMDHVKAAAT